MKRLSPILFFFCSACGVLTPATHSVDKLDRLSAGMERSAVISTLGEPKSTPVPGKPVNGATLQVDQYGLYGGHSALWAAILGPFTLTWFWWVPPSTHLNSYWVQYADGKLSRWGKANSWTPDAPQSVAPAPGNN